MTCVSPTGKTLTGNAYRNEIDEKIILRVALKYGFTQNVRVCITDSMGDKDKFVFDVVNGSISLKAGDSILLDPKSMAQVIVLSNFFKYNKDLVKQCTLDKKILKALYHDRMNEEWKDMPRTDENRTLMWEATQVLGYIANGGTLFNG